MKHKCMRCMCEWEGRKEAKPKYCAKCHSPYWDRIKERYFKPRKLATA